MNGALLTAVNAQFGASVPSEGPVRLLPPSTVALSPVRKNTLVHGLDAGVAGGVGVAGTGAAADDGVDMVSPEQPETTTMATVARIEATAKPLKTTKSVIDWNASEAVGRARKPSFMMSANSAAQR
jgi:hypothetical protein